MWNQTPNRSKILKEIQEISENYLTTAFTMPDMFPDGVISLKTGGFEMMAEVLAGKRRVMSKTLMAKLQSETYTKQTAEKAMDFLKLLNKIENRNICQNLFKSCCESNENFPIGSHSLTKSDHFGSLPGTLLFGRAGPKSGNNFRSDQQTSKM